MSRRICGELVVLDSSLDSPQNHEPDSRPDADLVEISVVIDPPRFFDHTLRSILD